MSYVWWKVVPSSRRCDGERAVAECRVSRLRGTAMDGDCADLIPALLMAMEVGT